MPMKLPKYLFEGAAHEADVHGRIDWSAANRFDSVYSEHCPALYGTDRDFWKFLGHLVCAMASMEDVPSEQDVTDLVDRVVKEQSGKAFLFGFAGLELT